MLLPNPSGLHRNIRSLILGSVGAFGLGARMSPTLGSLLCGVCFFLPSSQRNSFGRGRRPTTPHGPKAAATPKSPHGAKPPGGVQRHTLGKLLCLYHSFQSPPPLLAWPGGGH